MAFEEVVSLDAAVTVSLGKLNKKTGRKDPATVEGYYLGAREVDTKLGKSSIHFFKFQPSSENKESNEKLAAAYRSLGIGPGENVGVWGTGDLNKKLKTIRVGTMTKAEFVGMTPTPKGDMRSFKVAKDKLNTIEVELNASAPVEYAEEEQDDEDVDNVEANDSYQDDYQPQQVQLSAAERAQKVQALLNKNKKK